MWYLECESSTLDKLSDGSRIAAMVTVVVLDWEMLAVGFVYEAEWKFFTDLLDSIIGVVPMLRFPGAGLYLGWFPFIGIFVPMFVAYGTAVHSDIMEWGLFTVIVTFLTWAFYGIVALYWRKPSDAKYKNTSYNILDIVRLHYQPCGHERVADHSPYPTSGKQKCHGVGDEHRSAQPLHRDARYAMGGHRLQRNAVEADKPLFWGRNQWVA